MEAYRFINCLVTIGSSLLLSLLLQCWIMDVSLIGMGNNSVQPIERLTRVLELYNSSWRFFSDNSFNFFSKYCFLWSNFLFDWRITIWRWVVSSISCLILLSSKRIIIKDWKRDYSGKKNENIKKTSLHCERE